MDREIADLLLGACKVSVTFNKGPPPIINPRYYGLTILDYCFMEYSLSFGVFCGSQ